MPSANPDTARNGHPADDCPLSEASMTVCGNPHLLSLSGVKRTCLLAPHMSAFDPKWTFKSSLERGAVSEGSKFRYL